MRPAVTALLAGCLLALPASAAAGVRVVRGGDRVELAGSDVTCAIVRPDREAPAATCFLLRAGRATVGSYGVLLSDRTVAATWFASRTGTNRQVFVRAQPKLHSPLVDRLTGPSGRTVTLGPGDVAKVSGTRILLSAGRSSRGAAAIGLVLVDRRLEPAPGTYAVRISAVDVVVARVAAGGGARVVFRGAHGR